VDCDPVLEALKSGIKITSIINSERARAYRNSYLHLSNLCIVANVKNYINYFRKHESTGIISLDVKLRSHVYY
jgi:CDP-diacylglycerol pyrophosphatase